MEIKEKLLAVLSNNTKYGVLKKLNESKLNESEKLELGIIVDQLELSPEKVELISSEQIEKIILLLDQEECKIKNVDDLLKYIDIIFQDETIPPVRIENITNRHLFEIGNLVKDFNIVSELELSDTDKWELSSIREMLKDYLDTECLFINDMLDDIDFIRFQRSMKDDKIIFEGLTVDEKEKKIDAMDQTSIVLLYSVATNNYNLSLSDYNDYMKSYLKNDVLSNPSGKISNMLNPITKEESDFITDRKYKDFNESDWEVFKDNYRSTGKLVLEKYFNLYKNIFSVSESLRLLRSSSVFNIAKGINEELYMVAGKNLTLIKKI